MWFVPLWQLSPHTVFINFCLCSYERVLMEKEAVEQEFLLYRKEVKHTSAGASTKVNTL